MKTSHFLMYAILWSTVVACNSEKPVPSVTAVEPVTMANTPEPDTLPKASTHKNDTLPANSGPYRAYSFVYNQTEYTVPTDSLAPWGTDWFDGLAYGLVSEGKELLATEFDKIGSPHVLAMHCVEVVSKNQSGLYHLGTQRFLKPQYALLLPTLTNSSKTTLMAQKDGHWYRLQVSDFSTTPVPHFSLAEYLQHHRFTLDEARSSGLILKDLQGRYEGDDYYVIPPHYLTVLKLFPPQIHYSRSINASSPYVETIASESLGRRILSMLVTIYDESLNTRGMVHEQVDLMVFKDDEEMTRQTISEWAGLGTHQEYRFINDSLVEVKVEIARDAYPEHNQDNPYEYYLIARDGKIATLTCNRAFGFTKFTFIDNSYFKGNFIRPMTAAEKDEFAKRDSSASKRCSGNWITEHLSIEDLDVMQNEILAEYGLRFKTPKWQEYFSDKSWYQARYDDVNHLLNERDRHNIQVILRAKTRLEKNGEVILNKIPQLYLPVP